MATKIQTERSMRSIPLTHNRALTELVRCRGCVGAARESLQLALEIFGRLGSGSVAPRALDLEEILGRLEEAEAAILEVTP